MHFKNITEQKIAYKLLTLAAFVTVVLFVVRVIYAGAIALPYPQEIQEASSVALTNMFLEGKSPYLAASIQYEVPGINYDYPFFASLLAAAIAALFKCSAVVAPQSPYFLRLKNTVKQQLLRFLPRFCSCSVTGDMAMYLPHPMIWGFCF